MAVLPVFVPGYAALISFRLRHMNGAMVMMCVCHVAVMHVVGTRTMRAHVPRLCLHHAERRQR
ncbi:MAG: hypothetical protein AAF968_14325 [Pseudomonadota bacterium]